MTRVEVRILTPDEREALDLARERAIRRLAESLFRKGLGPTNLQVEARLLYAETLLDRGSRRPAMLRALGIDLTV